MYKKLNFFLNLTEELTIILTALAGVLADFFFAGFPLPLLRLFSCGEVLRHVCTAYYLDEAVDKLVFF